MIKQVCRTVMSMGKNALYITLPVEWCKKHNIQKGDIVKVDELGTNDLIVSKMSYHPEDAADPVKVE